MNNIHAQLVLFERYSTYSDLIHSDISSQSIGRHIQHCILAMQEIMQQVIASDPQQYHWSFNIGRIVVLGTGYIPRGRAKAPAFTIPQAVISQESLQKDIQELYTLLEQFLAITDPHKRCQHPFFGKLTQKQSLRNIIVHNHHHLKIINDIFTA